MFTVIGVVILVMVVLTLLIVEVIMLSVVVIGVMVFVVPVYVWGRLFAASYNSQNVGRSNSKRGDLLQVGH